MPPICRTTWRNRRSSRWEVGVPQGRGDSGTSEDPMGVEVSSVRLEYGQAIRQTSLPINELHTIPSDVAIASDESADHAEDTACRPEPNEILSTTWNCRRSTSSNSPDRVVTASTLSPPATDEDMLVTGPLRYPVKRNRSASRDMSVSSLVGCIAGLQVW